MQRSFLAIMGVGSFNWMVAMKTVDEPHWSLLRKWRAVIFLAIEFSVMESPPWAIAAGESGPVVSQS